MIRPGSPEPHATGRNVASLSRSRGPPESPAPLVATPKNIRSNDVSPTLIPAAVLVAISVVGILVLRRFSKRARLSFDVVCFLAISFYLLKEQIVPVFPPLAGPIEGRAIGLRALAGVWWWLGARIIAVGLEFAVRRDRRSREVRLFSDLLAAAIYIAAAAVVLNSVLALPVTGVVATSGVVAIVLGLALQSTLADVFSGIAVGIEAPFGIGDRILIGDKIEGQVVQMNWRSIRVQTDGNDIAIIPNNLVAKAEIINRSFPSQQRAASVEIACRKSAAPERVIEALLQATLLCPDMLRKPPPRAVLAQLGPKRNVYEVSFFVARTNQLATTKDLLLRGAQRQLYYRGFLDRGRDGEAGGAGEKLDTKTPHRLLSDLVLFENLEPEQIRKIAAQAESRQLELGERLFAEGADDTSLYVIASGVLELTRQTPSALETIGCIGAGEYVGEIGLLTGAPHAGTATARTHSQIFQLPRAAIAPLLSGNPSLAAAFDRAVRRGLEILHREVATRATPSVGPAGQLLMKIRRIFH
jgi:small-conductance mechanosensitive channel/CRP-like cAMP-binding protein